MVASPLPAITRLLPLSVWLLVVTLDQFMGYISRAGSLIVRFHLTHTGPAHWGCAAAGRQPNTILVTVSTSYKRMLCGRYVRHLS
jgi:hypothetical protein